MNSNLVNLVQSAETCVCFCLHISFPVATKYRPTERKTKDKKCEKKKNIASPTRRWDHDADQNCASPVQNGMTMPRIAGEATGLSHPMRRQRQRRGSAVWMATKHSHRRVITDPTGNQKLIASGQTRRTATTATTCAGFHDHDNFLPLFTSQHTRPCFHSCPHSTVAVLNAPSTLKGGIYFKLISYWAINHVMLCEHCATVTLQPLI